MMFFFESNPVLVPSPKIIPNNDELPANALVNEDGKAQLSEDGQVFILE